MNKMRSILKMKKVTPMPHKIRVIIDMEPQYILNIENYA